MDAVTGYPDARDLDIGANSFRLREIVSADATAVRALHQQVFGLPTTEAWYTWKYVDGAGQAMGLWHGEDLIAHCGGLPRRLWLSGVSIPAIQIGDVMVAQQWRALMTRRGPFFYVCDAFYSAKVGVDREFSIGFGFPNERHMRLARMSGLADGTDMHELVWESSPKQRERFYWVSGFAKKESPSHHAFESKVSHAWSRMVRDSLFGSCPVGDRSYTYVRRRYLERPDRRYIYVGLYKPLSTKPFGICVVHMSEQGTARWHWIDWIGAVSDMAFACVELRRMAMQSGASGLFCWASEKVAHALEATSINSSAVIARIAVTHRRSIEDAWIETKDWWMMSGDTDFL